MMGVTEEHAIPEGAPASSGWISTKLTQIWVRIDGMLHRLRGIEQHLQNERGPDPDADWEKDSRDLRNLIQHATREGARRATIDIETYHEGGGNGWNRWIMPGLVTLAVTGIVGNVIQYAQLSSLKQEVTDMRVELNDLKKLVEPRYRGPE